MKTEPIHEGSITKHYLPKMSIRVGVTKAEAAFWAVTESTDTVLRAAIPLMQIGRAHV